MLSDPITKAVAPLVKLIQKETAAPLLIEIKELRLELAHARKTLVPKTDTAPIAVENRQLKAKLRKALEQRDEWKYHARRYHATIIGKKLRVPTGGV
jgi:hypothetical protein